MSLLIGCRMGSALCSEEGTMQLIRCTGKLQKEMGLKKSDLIEEECSVSKLGPWHANLIHINGRKCILFANDKTLLNFIVTDVTRAEIRELSKMFLNTLICVLADEGISNSVIDAIKQEYAENGYAKTNNKSVLGSMNDLAFHYKFLIQDSGGVYSHMVPSIIKKLNHMPMGAINYAYSIDAFRAMYEAKH